MSQLPKGTLLARNLLETTIVKGAALAIFTKLPFLNWWPMNAFIERILLEGLADKGLDESVAFGLALIYVRDRRAFDQEFIKNKMLDKTIMSPEEREASLVAQQKAVYEFIRRGPVS